MNKYLVSMAPKNKARIAYSILVTIVEAYSKEDALNVASINFPYVDCEDYKKPKAELIHDGLYYEL